MTETSHNYVDGEWVAADTGETFTVRNPADRSDVAGEFQQSGTEDAEAAVEAAAEASETWADTPGPERGRVLRAAGQNLADRKDELTETLVREEGKARPEAAGEVQRAVDIFAYYATKASDVGGR